MAQASDQLISGQQAAFTLSYTAPAVDPSWVKTTLLGWAPFKSAVKLLSVNDAGGAVQIVVMPQAGSQGLTIGGLASGAADTLNQAASAQSGGFSPGFAPAGLGAGLSTTSAWQQFQDSGGVTLNPFASLTPGGPSWESQLLWPSSSSSGGGSSGSGGGLSWMTLALIGLGVFVAVEVIT